MHVFIFFSPGDWGWICHEAAHRLLPSSVCFSELQAQPAENQPAEEALQAGAASFSDGCSSTATQTEASQHRVPGESRVSALQELWVMYDGSKHWKHSLDWSTVELDTSVYGGSKTSLQGHRDGRSKLWKLKAGDSGYLSLLFLIQYYSIRHIPKRSKAFSGFEFLNVFNFHFWHRALCSSVTFRLTKYLRTTLNFWSSSPYLQSAGITGHSAPPHPTQSSLRILFKYFVNISLSSQISNPIHSSLKGCSPRWP